VVATWEREEEEGEEEEERVIKELRSGDGSSWWSNGS
jgi:hypothetical protein